jgi:tetratricopeptide (TPR) repeat protein
VDVLESTQRYDSAISELQSWLEQGSVRNTGQTNYLQYRLFHCALSGGYGQLARNALNSLSGMAGSPFYTRLEAQWALETGDYAAATALVVDHLDRFMTADEYLASGEGGLVLAAQLQVGAIGLIVDDARAQLARLRGDSQHLDAGSPVVWLWQMGRREDVLELMVRIAQLPDSSPTLRDWANWQRLVMLMADNRTAEGLEILNIGIANKLEVSRSQYRTLKFVYLLLAEREDDAEAYLGEWIADAPYDILPRSMLAYLMDRQGRLEEFLEVLDLWLAGSEPAGGDMEEDWMRLGLLRLKISVLYDLRRNDDMIDCLAQAMELAPDDVSLQMLYASVLDDAGRFTEAIAIMDEALEADPRNPELLNNMAYMLAEGGIRLREAEVMINRALYEGVNAAYLDTKGWVLYKQGRIQPARRVLENTLVEARRTGMESPVLYDHAGDAYYRDGDVEQAREMWARAVELGDGSVVLTADDEDVLVLAAAKLAALDAGQVPRVAPLGQGVPDPLYPQEVEPIVAAPVAPGEDVDPVEGNE